MSKFIKNILLFFIPIFLFSSFVEIAVRKIPNDYLRKREYLDKRSDQVEVLILGSSHAYRGIDPNIIDLQAFNASYVSQSLDYDYAIIKKYEDNWRKLKYIVIPVSYFSFYYKLENGQDAWRAKNYAIYYNINLSGKFTDNSEFLSNKLSVNLERLYSYYFLQRSNISSTALGFGARTGLVSNADLNETGKAAAIRQTAKSGYYFDQNNFSENVDILNNIIQFANKKGIDVILYTPPGYNSYVESMNKEQLTRTISTATQLDDLYSNVVYINFLNDVSFTNLDFWDGDHLADIGAQKLTKKINLLLR